MRDIPEPKDLRSPTNELPTMKLFKFFEHLGKQTYAVPVTTHAANRRADKSVGFRSTSNLEISSDELAEIDRHLGESGWLIFGDLQDQGEPPPKSTGLSCSKRLRREIELNYELGVGYSPLTKEEYYNETMQKYIEHARSKRNE